MDDAIVEEITSSLYRFDKSFEENARLGPRFEGPFPEIPSGSKKDFFGYAVNSRFGIAAGPGINSKWISLYSQFGFDILTYKTVRLRERIAHAAPNFTFLQSDTSVRQESDIAVAAIAPTLPLALAPTGASIGMPSLSPDFWTEDIKTTKELLRPGQVLIVSVVGTSVPGMTEDEFISEFATLTKMVVAAGADIVEANLSCPNVQADEGEVYKDPALSAKIASAIRQEAGGRPVLLKIGHCGTTLRTFCHAVNGLADGIVMINALGRKIQTMNGEPAFGAERHKAGVHGGALFPVALDHVKEAIDIIHADGLNLKIVGVGGASTVERVCAYLEAGACAALVASSALFLPNMARIVKTERPDI